MGSCPEGQIAAQHGGCRDVSPKSPMSKFRRGGAPIQRPMRNLKARGGMTKRKFTTPKRFQVGGKANCGPGTGRACGGGYRGGGMTRSRWTKGRRTRAPHNNRKFATRMRHGGFVRRQGPLVKRSRLKSRRRR
tara:strand:- start:278 stop:676 length:399 start_codon:yes stop_codon:yes gene_type:complete